MGIGDTLALTLIKTTKSNQQLAPSSENQNVLVTPQQIDETINSTGRIGSDGSVLLLEVGRLEAIEKSQTNCAQVNILTEMALAQGFSWRLPNSNYKKLI